MALELAGVLDLTSCGVDLCLLDSTQKVIVIYQLQLIHLLRRSQILMWRIFILSISWSILVGIGSAWIQKLGSSGQNVITWRVLWSIWIILLRYLRSSMFLISLLAAFLGFFIFYDLNFNIFQSVTSWRLPAWLDDVLSICWARGTHLLLFVAIVIDFQLLVGVLSAIEFIYYLLGASLAIKWSCSDLFGRISSLSLVVKVTLELSLSSCSLSPGTIKRSIELEARVHHACHRVQFARKCFQW